MASYFASLRTNMTFSVKYETAELEPMIEIIFLTYKPDYVVKSGKVEKRTGLDEYRIELPARDINKVIAELQLAANALNPFTQAGDAINSIIKGMKKDEPKSDGA